MIKSFNGHTPAIRASCFVADNATAFAVAEGEARGVLLSADSLLSMNTLRDQQVAERPDAVTVTGGVVKVTVKRLSFGEYVIPLIP